MGSYVFDHVKLKIAQSNLSFKNVTDGSFKLVLVTSGVFDDFNNGALSNETSWDDISEYEISEPDYNTDGYTDSIDLNDVGTLEVDVGGFTELKISATDISIPVSKIDACGAIIYKNDEDNTLISAIDFGGKVSSNNGVFVINLSTNGWLRIK